MPRRVDYPARFAFLRRAAFVVVRDVGPHALSRRAVAAALGISVNSVVRLVADDADLRGLALDDVDRRRREARWRQPRGLAGRELALVLLRSLLPVDEEQRSEGLVRLRLAIDACRPPVPVHESVAALRAEHAMALHGFVDAPLEGPAVPTDAGPGALAERLASDDAARARTVAEALTAIGVSDEREQRRTLALVDGLALDACLGTTTPAEAVTTLEHHVASLSAAPGPAHPDPR